MENSDEEGGTGLKPRSKESLAVTLTVVVGLLSLVTGAANLATTSRFALVAQFVPEVVRNAVALTGAFTGFAMLVSAWGLKRRLNAAWYSAVVLFPVTALQGVVQSSVVSFPLILLSVAAIPTLVVSRGSFSRKSSLSASQRAASVTFLGVLLYGTVGTYALRTDFSKVQTPLDAFYFTVVTASTVGYGDVTPSSGIAETFTLSLIVVGTAGFAFVIAALVTPGIEARLKGALGKMTETQLELLDDHIIVLGYGELTEPILTELKDKAEFVVVTQESDVAQRLGERGYNVLTADPSDEESLEKVNIEKATAVVAATNNDAEDALSVLTARQLNPEVRVVAAATDIENIGKLKRAGADTVISPAGMAGHLLVESALRGSDAEKVAERILDEESVDGGEGDGRGSTDDGS
ncbi:MAG: NAD-binding protein [Halobacteria archaeon]|nr:NAD-binding protein [Halobacteria archaeon]